MAAIFSGLIVVGCSKDKLTEGSSAVYDPVGTWFITSTPATFDLGTCEPKDAWQEYSDTMAITLDGNSLTGIQQRSPYSLDTSTFSGTFSNNTIEISRLPTGQIPLYSQVKPAGVWAPERFSNSFSLGMTSDNSASGTESWRIAYTTHSCSGTQTVVATKQ